MAQLDRTTEAAEIESCLAELGLQDISECRSPTIAHHGRAAYERVGDVVRAHAAAERAVELAPNNPGFRVHLLLTAQRRNLGASNITKLTRSALAAHSGDERLRVVASALLQSVELYDEAIAVIEEGLSLHPNSVSLASGLFRAATAIKMDRARLIRTFEPHFPTLLNASTPFEPKRAAEEVVRLSQAVPFNEWVSFGAELTASIHRSLDRILGSEYRTEQIMVPLYYLGRDLDVLNYVSDFPDPLNRNTIEIALKAFVRLPQNLRSAISAGQKTKEVVRWLEAVQAYQADGWHSAAAKFKRLESEYNYPPFANQLKLLRQPDDCRVNDRVANVEPTFDSTGPSPVRLCLSCDLNYANLFLSSFVASLVNVLPSTLAASYHLDLLLINAQSAGVAKITEALEAECGPSGIGWSVLSRENRARYPRPFYTLGRYLRAHEVLTNSQAVWVLDIDTVFKMNPVPTLQNLARFDCALAINPISQSLPWTHISAGCSVFYNTPAARRFLGTFAEYVESEYNPNADQWFIDQIGLEVAHSCNSAELKVANSNIHFKGASSQVPIIFQPSGGSAQGKQEVVRRLISKIAQGAT